MKKCRNIKPIINIKGYNTYYLEWQKNYVDPGYTAKLQDKDISDQVKITGTVNPNKLGTYILKYSVTYNGLTAEVTRKVIVRDTTKPLLSIKDDEVYVYQFTTYDLMTGVIAMDNFDGDITKKVQADFSIIDSNKPTTYTNIYSK